MGSLLRTMQDEGELETDAKAGITVVYKHSERCFACRRSLRHMESFAEERPDIPVYIIDVVDQRALSGRIAASLGVPHESPQVILLHRGQPVWNGSHFAVTAAALQREVDRLGENG